MIDLEFIRTLVAKGGPEESDYHALTCWVTSVYDASHCGQLSEDCIAQIRNALGETVSIETMQGFALNKPHGYAGDFEIIDRIYQSRVSDKAHLSRWDSYFHCQAAPTAVRNRKAYFHDVLNALSERQRQFRVLNVASGPGRCMHEWLSAHPDSMGTFQCIELDAKAIAFATELNRDFLPRIEFTRANVVRFRAVTQYDLVWAAGIFDYFSDKIFVAVLKRLRQAIEHGGEAIIGNFAEGNPSRAYMETVGDWKLFHRSQEQLLSLAESAGIDRAHCRIGAEQAGVNYFLHVKP